MSAAAFQPNGNGDNAASPDLEVGTMSEVMQSLIPRASAPTRGQLATSLFVVSSFTVFFGLTVVFHLPAGGPVFGGYEDCYYIILEVVLAAAAVELVAAYWLARSSGPLILALAKVILPVAYLLLLVVFALGGFVIPFSKVTRSIP